MKAAIKNAKIMRIDDIWKKHKPQGLGFSDTDAIVIDLKIKNSKERFTQSFYCRLKADGTLGHSITRASEKRQKNLQNFIKKYINKAERYNIRNNINKWKGKEVSVTKINGSYIINI